MARVGYFDAVLKKEPSGLTSVVQGATVSVYDSGTVNLATIYENDGTTLQTSPITTDASGNYSLRAEEGAYDIRTVYSGFDEIKNNIIFGSSPTANLTLGTGLLNGGIPSVNGDGLTVDFTAGSGKIVDNYSSPPNVTIIDVSWNAFTAVVPAFKGTSLASFIGVDSNGNVFQQDTFPRGQGMRDYIWIGSAVHGDGVNVTSFNEFGVAPITQVSKVFDDLYFALGVINVSGNRATGSSNGNLKLFKSSGEVNFAGIDWQDDKGNPNNKLVPSLDEPDFLLTYQDGAGGWTTIATDSVVPSSYDDGDGVLGTVANNNWSIVRIQYSPDANLMGLHYGQNVYSSSSGALNALSTGADSFAINPALAAVPFINYLVVKGNATDLTDPATSIFINADKFGDTGGQASSSPSTVTKQSAYENGSEPELVTNDLRGADSWKRGTSGGDTDDVIEILNGSDVKTFAITGEGKLEVYGADIVEKTASYTMLSSDSGKVLYVNSGSNLQITVPSGLANGFNITVVRYGSGTVEILPSSTTVNSISGNKKVKDQYGAVTIIQKATDEFYLAGSLEA